MKLTVHHLYSTIAYIKGIDAGAAASKGLNKASRLYRKRLPAKIKSSYATRLSKTAISTMIHSKASTKATMKATVSVMYVPHRLAWFEVKQVAITTGGQKRVTSKGRGLGFSQRNTRSKAFTTKVRIRKDKGFLTVNGSMGHKGFLQDSYSQIFERSQRATWAGKKRLPTHALFGLSVSQMANSKIVTSKMRHYKVDVVAEQEAFKNV